MLMRLTSANLSTKRTWLRVAEGNCDAVRHGGEQPDAKLSSQNSLPRQLNPIRPFGVVSLRTNGETLVDDQTQSITKHVAIEKDSEGVWGEKAGKAHQLSKDIPLGATESQREVRASIVALKRVMTVEPREVGK